MVTPPPYEVNGELLTQLGEGVDAIRLKTVEPLPSRSLQHSRENPVHDPFE